MHTTYTLIWHLAAYYDISGDGYYMLSYANSLPKQNPRQTVHHNHAIANNTQYITSYISSKIVIVLSKNQYAFHKMDYACIET